MTSEGQFNRATVAENFIDFYADGKAAQTWGQQTRTKEFRQWLVGLLQANECRTVLDAACGTGVDSILLIEEGFSVVSVDASEQMVKFALQERNNRSEEPGFDQWIIKTGNWLTLVDDVAQISECSPLSSSVRRFDAILCIGNSFPHLPNNDGTMINQRRAISNFIELLNPGGIMLIEHRNYDEILRTGVVQANNVSLATSHDVRIKITHSDVNPGMLIFNYYTTMSSPESSVEDTDFLPKPDFTLSYYPHQLEDFTRLLKDVCGPEVVHSVYGDYKPLGEITTPTYYIHVIKKLPRSDA